MPRPEVLLLTDIVDSTQITQQLGDAGASALWQAHDRQARALLAPWGGREIDKSDGLLLLFAGVADAVAYAAAYHRVLAGLAPPLQARVAIHTGPLWLRENPASEVALGAKMLEVDGLAKAVVARLMSLARGGQTLLSQAARDVLAADGQAGMDEPRAHGHWRLKGVPEPLAVWAVGEGAETPPQDSPKAWRVIRQDGDLWLPVQALPHSLPAERDRFFGRRQALAQLAALIGGGARLVSLVGMGGMGKTRLAQHFGWQSQGEFAGGIWFCDLSAAQSVDGLVHAVAQGLTLPLTGADPVAQIGQALAGRGDCLVVADNFEQITRHAPATLGRWLDAAPRARFLVTTREVLGLPGEQVLMLEPLEAEEGAQLFASRAESATGRPLAGDQVATLDRLVAMLDGMPLALELAASRARLIAPSDMLRRMGERFRLLFARQGRVERHASLQATLDWSWDLLTGPEQATLMQLSVFVGGFDAEAAQATVAFSAASDADVIDAVASLVDKSLLRPARDGRFAMLEMVRDYAAAQRRAAGLDEPGRDTPVARHWRHFASLTEARAVAHRCADLDNLIAACRAAAGAGDGVGATGALANAWAALRLVGPYRAAVELAQATLDIAHLTPEQRSIAHAVAGSALNALGQAAEASAHLSAGLGLVADRPPSTAMGRLYLAEGLRQTLTAEVDGAASCLDRALEMADRLDDVHLRVDALTGLGRLHDHQAHIPEARRYYEAALVLAREMGDQRLAGGLLGNLGGLLHDLGRLDEARSHYEQSLAACEDAGDRVWGGNACSNLGLVLLDQGRHAEASHYLDRALAVAESCGNARLAYTVRCNLGIALAAEGKLPLAERQFRSAVESAVASGDKRSEGQFLGYLAVTLARLGRHEEARTCLDRGEVNLSALSDRLSLALLLCDRAEVAATVADLDTARAALAAAASIADELQCEPASELRRRLTAQYCLRSNQVATIER